MIDNLVILVTCGGVVAVVVRAILMERGKGIAPRTRTRR